LVQSTVAATTKLSADAERRLSKVLDLLATDTPHRSGKQGKGSIAAE
jgi:hypothetical protein